MSSSINSRSSAAFGAFIQTLIVIGALLAGTSCRPSSGSDADDGHGGTPEPGDGDQSSLRNYYHGGDTDKQTVELGEVAPQQPLAYVGDFVSNHIPINPDGGHQDAVYGKSLSYPVDPDSVVDGQKKPAAPKYMVDLYNKFSTDRYIHPVTNIVRSFMNINEDTSELTPAFGNKTRVHILVFNITSISRDEDIYMAELRLYKLVEADRDQFKGVNRRVSVHELIYDAEQGNSSVIIAEKNLYGPDSGWETFLVTDAVRRWVDGGLPYSYQILEIRIDSVDAAEDNVNIDFDTRQHNENEPLLVVFSNDHQKKRTETRELHEMITQELKLYDIIQEDPLDNEIDEDYDAYDYDYDFGHDFGPDFPEDYQLQKRDTSSVERHEADRSSSPAPATDTEPAKVTANVSPKSARFAGYRSNELGDSESRKRLEKLYKQILAIGDPQELGRTRKNDTRYPGRRSGRSSNKKRRRRGRRRFCRRRPLYVDFQDINWHTWIIAPRGYQAYQCSGKCDFPLSDHLTPTKHAIIQTLVHTNYAGVRRRHKTEPACCVPTKLEPISILYIDDKGVVTYKYDYDEMVVTECGCR